MLRERAVFTADFWDIAPYLFVAPEEYSDKDAAKFWKRENCTPAFAVADFIAGYDGPLVKEKLGGSMEDFIRGNGWPMGKVMNCLRLALTGAASGLGIADIIVLIGKQETARRIGYAKNTLQIGD